MRFDISQKFYFDAAHTLDRQIEAAGSRRIHGHTYHAEVTLSGTPAPSTGMVEDLGHLKAVIATVRDTLDHHLLDEVPELGPPTLENLCAYIARKVKAAGVHPSRVKVWREAAGDACTLHLDQ